MCICQDLTHFTVLLFKPITFLQNSVFRGIYHTELAKSFDSHICHDQHLAFFSALKSIPGFFLLQAFSTIQRGNENPDVKELKT